MNYFEAMKSLGKPIAYYPKLAKSLGGARCSLLFGQLLFWQDKTDNPLGVYKTVAELEEETGLSEDEQETACKKLIKLGVLTKTYKRLQHRMYYKLNAEKFNEIMAQYEAARETGNPPFPKPEIPLSGKGESGVGETGNPPLDETGNPTFGTTEIPCSYKEQRIHTENTQRLQTESKPRDARAGGTHAAQMQILQDMGVSEQVAADHLAIRKAKRCPLTVTAAQQMQKEAAASQLSLQQALEVAIGYGWATFRADWLAERMGKRTDFVPTTRQVETIPQEQGGVFDGAGNRVELDLPDDTEINF
ncbi:MAG: DNA replication protein [Kingella sp. (in: b-proteobacteria)]|nr:MAG: DNA replication protein [Kingella sp. (in: b-proteobacteria)]